MALPTRPNLSVSGLEVSLGTTPIVRGVSFTVFPERIMGLAGESGSGKSVTCLTLLRLQPPAMSVSGSILSDGRDIFAFDRNELRAFRARDARIVFQDPSSSFDPFMSIGAQLTESVRAAKPDCRRQDARTHAVEILDAVGIPVPAERLKAYPRELSGGMLQRVSIAMALIAEPKLLICDEPTTSLDATTAVQILELLRSICRTFHVSIVLTTHDLGIVADYCDEVAVMYSGEIVEAGPARPSIERPHHPYTWSLVNAAPGRSSAMPHTPLSTLVGDPLRPEEVSDGCRFAPRCPFQASRCLQEKPELIQRIPDEERRAACLFAPAFAEHTND